MSSDENTTPFECFEAEDSSGDNVTSLTEARQKRKPKASYADYLQLIEDVLGETKRDIFSGDLCFFDDKKQRWLPIFHEDSFGDIKSKAAETKGFFTLSHIEHHIYRRTRELDGQLLVDIPAWDGRDRIAEIAECLECSNFPSTVVEDLLKDWLGKIFSRLRDPHVQNRILVLAGRQKLGKDSLVYSMLGGLGQFLSPFTVCQNERDTQSQLIGALVLLISEYDRTSRTDVAALKHMITTPRANFRAAYGRRAIDHEVRSSFVATCNLDTGLLRDPTGNRRYIIFQLDKIRFEYERNQSAQILAQALKLSKEGFNACTTSESILTEYLEEQTPDSVEDLVCQAYESLVASQVSVAGTASSSMGDIWSQLAKKCERHVDVCRTIIKQKGYHAKGENNQLYFPTIDAANEFKNAHNKRVFRHQKQKPKSNIEEMVWQAPLPEKEEIPF